MKIAAIYARKSTKDDYKEEAAQSVPMQIDEARKFAASKSWTIDGAHVYSDVGKSGADPKRCVNRQRLLDLIYSGRAPFQVLIVRDESRLSRRDGDVAVAEQSTRLQ